MQDVLAIEWDNRQIRGAVARVSDERVSLTLAFDLVVPAHLVEPDQAENAGKWLRESLCDLNIEATRTFVALPSDAVVARHLEVPLTPEDQIADVVQLQVATRSSGSPDDELTDFLCLPQHGDDGLQRVLAATLPRRRAEQIQNVLSAAGLQVESIGFTPLALAEFVAQFAARNDVSMTGCNLIVAQIGSRIEMVLTQQHDLLFSHSARFAQDDDTALDSKAVLSSITRSLIAAEQVWPNVDVDHVWLVGMSEAQPALQDELRRRFSENLHAIDSQDESNAIPVGLLNSHVNSTSATIDFLRPRRAAVVADRSKLRIGLVVAATIVLALFLYNRFASRVADLQTEKQLKQEQLEHLEQIVERGSPLVEAATQVDEWESRNIDWLDQMTTIGQSLPKTDALYLQSWRFDSVVGDTLGRIRADGYSVTRANVEQMNQRLAENHFLRLLPHEIGQQTAYVSGYPIQFELDLELTGKVVTEKPDSSEPRP